MYSIRSKGWDNFKLHIMIVNKMQQHHFACEQLKFIIFMLLLHQNKLKKVAIIGLVQLEGREAVNILHAYWASALEH